MVERSLRHAEYEVLLKACLTRSALLNSAWQKPLKTRHLEFVGLPSGP
jgi:hypothetical protein